MDDLEVAPFQGTPWPIWRFFGGEVNVQRIGLNIEGNLEAVVSDRG